MTNPPEQQDSRLSEAGRARRDRMLPLIQDAMREGVRRRRRRRSVVGMVVLLCGVILGWELVESGRISRTESPQNRLAENEARIDPETPANPEGLLATVDIAKPVDSRWGGADWSSFDPAEAYASLITSNDSIMTSSTVTIPSDWLVQEVTLTLDVQGIDTRDLVTMLARSGISASVICSEDKCVLVMNEREETSPASM